MKFLNNIISPINGSHVSLVVVFFFHRRSFKHRTTEDC